MAERSAASSGGVGIPGFMFLILFTLKLAGPLESTSWWWVTSPLWAPLGLVLAGVLVYVPAAMLVEWRKDRWRRRAAQLR